MQAASLADTSIMQYSSCSTVSTSPSLMSAELPVGSMSLTRDGAATCWSRVSTPWSTASRVSRAVMTLVMLAGYSVSRSLRPYSIRPDS